MAVRTPSEPGQYPSVTYSLEGSVSQGFLKLHGRVSVSHACWGDCSGGKLADQPLPPGCSHAGEPVMSLS